MDACAFVAIDTSPGAPDAERSEVNPILRRHEQMSTSSDALITAQRRCRSGVWCRRCGFEQVRGDRPGEGAPVQEVLVVRPLDAVADAGAEPGSLELTILDPAAHGLLVGTDASGDIGD